MRAHWCADTTCVLSHAGLVDCWSNGFEKVATGSLDDVRSIRQKGATGIALNYVGSQCSLTKTHVVCKGDTRPIH